MLIPSQSVHLLRQTALNSQGDSTVPPQVASSQAESANSQAVSSSPQAVSTNSQGDSTAHPKVLQASRQAARASVNNPWDSSRGNSLENLILNGVSIYLVNLWPRFKGQY